MLELCGSAYELKKRPKRKREKRHNSLMLWAISIGQCMSHQLSVLYSFLLLFLERNFAHYANSKKKKEEKMKKIDATRSRYGLYR